MSEFTDNQRILKESPEKIRETVQAQKEAMIEFFRKAKVESKSMIEKMAPLKYPNKTKDAATIVELKRQRDKAAKDIMKYLETKYRKTAQEVRDCKQKEDKELPEALAELDENTLEDFSEEEAQAEEDRLANSPQSKALKAHLKSESSSEE